MITLAEREANDIDLELFRCYERVRRLMEQKDVLAYHRLNLKVALKMMKSARHEIRSLMSKEDVERTAGSMSFDGT